MRNTAIALAVVVALAAPAFGATYVTTAWNGGTESWHQDTNPPWDNGMPVYPPPADTYYTAYISNGGTPQVSSAIQMNTVTVGRDNVGHLELLAGTYSANIAALAVGYRGKASYGLSTITQYGGDVYSDGSNDILIGLGGWNGNGDPCGYGQWTILGGSIAQRNAAYRDTVVGANGGTNYTGNGFDYAIGRFKVVGTGPTSIQFNNYTQNPGSTLEIVLDAAGDVTLIQVIGTNDGYDDATLSGELLLDVGAYSGGPKTIDILSVTGTGTLDYSGLTLDAASIAAGWALGDDGAGTLQVVPEPATMVLLGIGGIGVLIRRRRK